MTVTQAAAPALRETLRIADLVTHFEATGNDARLSFMVERVSDVLAREPGNVDALLSRLYLGSRHRQRGCSLLDQINEVGQASGRLRTAVDPESCHWATVATKRAAAEARAEPNRGTDLWILSQALGIECLGAIVAADVSVRFRAQDFDIALGERTARWHVSSTGERFHFQHRFAIEPGMWRWLAGLGPDDVLLDVGANIGIYTIAAAALRSVPVIAVEPFEPNLQALRRNIALNALDDRVTVLPFAAAAEDGDGLLTFDSLIPGAASQHFVAEGTAAQEASATTVRGASIDRLIAAGTIPTPTHVKIDVDGGEDGVIHGMTEALSNPRLRQVRLEIRWWRPEKRPLVSLICRHGFRAEVDDDYKNLMFTRTAGPVVDDIVMPPEYLQSLVT